MTREEVERMWKEVYKVERDRFKAERDALRERTRVLEEALRFALIHGADLLRRLSEWDVMQTMGDGPYWQAEIARVKCELDDARASLAAVAVEDERKVPVGEGAVNEEPFDVSDMPADLLAALRDPSIVLPQDAAVYELVAKRASDAGLLKLRLCDDDGVVREGRPFFEGTEYPCTGSAHYDGVELRCDNPRHGTLGRRHLGGGAAP